MNTQTENPPLSYTVDGATKASGLGRTTIYSLISENRLRIVKVGRRTLIPADSLRALIAGEA
jgi:excisionase family DNA binding protein